MSSNNIKPCKLQQELLAAGVVKVNGGLGILAHALYKLHRAAAEALVLYDRADLEALSTTDTLADTPSTVGHSA